MKHHVSQTNWKEGRDTYGCCPPGNLQLLDEQREVVVVSGGERKKNEEWISGKKFRVKLLSNNRPVLVI